MSMFEQLSKKFQTVFSSLAPNRKLTEKNLFDAIQTVRLALLDADVNYGVVKKFIERVKEKALGQKLLLQSISPKDQFIAMIHAELSALMGEKETPLFTQRQMSVFMLCGLQGGGKTTQSAKLALMLKEQNKKPLLVGCDLQRPAAMDQIETLGMQIDVPVYIDRSAKAPVKVALAAIEHAKKESLDFVILDTAGRMHMDADLMQQLKELKHATCPHETLFVANAATGQDAVNVAKQFDEKICITGTILTMLEGNTRAGAALSIREVTGKPLLFEGTGEKMTDLQPFNPRSMADRILGMGDVINLVKKAERHFEAKESKRLEKKLRKATFSYDDFLKQMRLIKKMGSFKSLSQMIPGVSKISGFQMSDDEMVGIEAMILSMTAQERSGVEELVHPRRFRIAEGSGTSVDQVNRMIKGFKRIKQMMKNMPGFKKMAGKELDLKQQLADFNSLKKGFFKFP